MFYKVRGYHNNLIPSELDFDEVEYGDVIPKTVLADSIEEAREKILLSVIQNIQLEFPELNTSHLKRYVDSAGKKEWMLNGYRHICFEIIVGPDDIGPDDLIDEDVDSYEDFLDGKYIHILVDENPIKLDVN